MAAVAAPPQPKLRLPMQRLRLRRIHRDDLIIMLVCAVAALALVWLVYATLTIDPGTPGFVIWSYVAFVAIYWLAVRAMHGRLVAADRVMTVVVTSLTATMLAPLLLIIGDVAYQGWSVLTPHFFTQTVEFCGDLQAATCGGIAQAIVGTLEQVGIALVIAVPLAVACAVFLNEIGGPWTYAGERGARDAADDAYMQSTFANAGAMICGRTMYDCAEGWGDNPGFGVTMFVVTHRPQPAIVKGDSTFEFLSGIGDALERARAACGDKDVVIMGGGDVLRQCLELGAVDEFTLTLAPTLLGAGKRLFEGIRRTDIDFERVDVGESPLATHIRYRMATRQ